MRHIVAQQRFELITEPAVSTCPIKHDMVSNLNKMDPGTLSLGLATLLVWLLLRKQSRRWPVFGLVMVIMTIVFACFRHLDFFAAVETINDGIKGVVLEGCSRVPTFFHQSCVCH